MKNRLSDPLERAKFWLCIALLLGVGGFLAFTGWNHVALTRVLAREGVTTTGKVVDHSSESYSRRSSDLRLTVEFTPTNHPTVTKTLSVDGSTYHPAVKAGEVAIRYLPNQPERCTVGEMAAAPFYIIAAVGGIMLLAGGYLLARFGPAALAADR